MLQAGMGQMNRQTDKWEIPILQPFRRDKGISYNSIK